MREFPVKKSGVCRTEFWHVILKHGKGDIMEFLHTYRFLIRFLFKLLFLGVFIFLMLVFVIRPYRMSGNKMFPAVRDGDFAVFYRIGEPYVGDVVLYETDDGLQVGRVVAYGTQTVDFLDGSGYTVNDYVPSEEIPYPTEGGDCLTYPVQVPEGSVFLLNDFRPDLSDSRTYGVVSADQVQGKLLFLFRRRNF